MVVDDRDHAHVLRMFEALLDLRVGTLELQQDLANRSLTLAEVEALRAFNESYRSAELGRALRTRVVRQGVASHLKARKPEADEARIETPQWALDRAGEVAREMVANISASGVHIVGDLGRLTEVAGEQARRRSAAGRRGPADDRGVDVDRDPHRRRIRAGRTQGA